MKSAITFLILLISATAGFSQKASIKGRITSAGEPVAYASVAVIGTQIGGTSNDKGYFTLNNVPVGTHEISASSVGYRAIKETITLSADVTLTVDLNLEEVTSKLDEVVVTGVSRATEVKRSPIPIAIISRKEMNLNVNSNIIDAIVKGVPGVSATSTGPNISKAFIRGLGYNRVLNMYDGIRQEGQQWGDEHGTEVDQYGIERAEVVKGPASLTYGSDALAGVINMIPAVPKGVDGIPKGDFLIDYQGNNGMAALSLGTSYSKNGWRYSFRGSQKQAHDYKNRVDGLVYGTGFSEYNLSGTIRVDKAWGFSQISATKYDNQQEIPDGSRDSLTRQFTFPVFDDERDDIKNRPYVTDKMLKSYKVDDLHQSIQHYRVYTNNQYKVGNGNINATLGFQQSNRREYLSPVNTQQAALFLVLNTVNYDLRYNLPDWKGLQTTIGANGMYQQNKNKDALNYPIPDYNLFDIGGFVFLKKSFGKVDISGGLRYDTRKLKWDDFYVSKEAANLGRRIAGSPGDSVQFASFNNPYNGVSGSLGGTFNITERVMVKANLARGYRSPNINEVGANGLDPGAHIRYQGNREFVPEFNFQKDISFLAYLKDMDVSIELFDNQISNYIYQARLSDENGNALIDDQGNLTYKYNQSKARLYGGEATVNLHPNRWKWLNFNNSISYVNGLNKNETLIKQFGNDAKYLPFILPLHFRSEIRGTIRKSLGSFTGVYARVELDAFAKQTKIYAVDNTEMPSKGYSLINLGFGGNVKQQSGRVVAQLFVQVSNLFDVAYQSHLNRLRYFEYYQNSPTRNLGIYNMGRNVSAKVIIPF